MGRSCIEIPFFSRCSQSTEGIAILLGSCLVETISSHGEASLVVALIGPLGAGKTVFARALARSLGVEPKAVASPTFVVERIYQGIVPVRHFDLYRIDEERLLLEIGFEEELGKPGLTTVEWAERAEGMLREEERIEIVFDVTTEDTRHIIIRDYYMPSIVATCFGVHGTFADS
jgi:tRNA threonylcarbamoyladenosine biosynthesis protein TsaE